MKAIKVWIIIGMILTPAAIGGPIMRVIPSPQNLVVLLLYAITVPLGIYTLKKLKKAKCRQDVIGVGILCIFLVSLIGGILILASDDKIYQNNRSSVNANTNISVEQKKKIKTEEEIRKEFIKLFDDNDKFNSFFASQGIKTEEELEGVFESESNDNFEKYYCKANCYLRGVIYKKDMKCALKNFCRASDLGHGESSYFAGMFYLLGIGTDENKKDAAFYINRGMFQGYNMAKDCWDENFEADYNFNYKNKNSLVFESIKEKYGIDNKDIELNELLDHLINVISTQGKIENKKDSKRLAEIIGLSIDNVIKNIEIIYKKVDKRQKLVAALDLSPYMLVREGSDVEFKEQTKIYNKYFGKSTLENLVEPGDSNLTFIARHCALIYKEIINLYPDKYSFDQLLWLTITINMGYYISEEQLTVSMMDEIVRWSKKLILVSEAGLKYTIPENENGEISQASIISAYCIYLICHIDNESIPDKSVIEYIITNYFSIKENVTKIFKNQLTSSDKTYRLTLKQAIKKVIRMVNEGETIYDA